MKKYRGIVIGTGAIGALLEAEPKRPRPATHAGALSAHKKTELVAIVDTDKKVLESASKLFTHARTYTSLEDALKSEQVDIACIATGAGSHLKIIEALCKAGVPMIICEKPVAGNAPEARAIEKLIIKHKVTFVLNYQRRFFKTFNTIRNELKKGKLGSVQTVTAYYSNGLANNGGHSIDAVQYFLDDCVVSVSTTRGKGIHPKGDMQVFAQLQFKKGTIATLIPLDQSAYGIHDFHIYGTKGAYYISDYGYTVTFVPVRVSRFARVRQLDAAQAKAVHLEESMVAGALEELIRTHESSTKGISGTENGLAVMTVLDAVAESVKKDKTIRIQA